VETPEILAKAHEVTVAGYSLTGETKQKDDRDLDLTPEDALRPPLDLDQLARLSQVSSTRAAIIDAIARNTVGLGYTPEVADGHEQEVTDPRDEARKLRVTLEALASRDRRLDSPTFTDLLYAVKTDEEEVGQGYLEVSRDKLTGKIDGLFHAPAKLVRRKKDRSGWVMVDPHFGDEDVEFSNFGDKVEYDDQGEPTGTLKAGGSWSKNELISFRLYSSESRDYGLPRDVGLALEYAGDKLAAEYNIGFFDAGGTPPSVIFISGEATDGGRITFKVPQQTVERIASTIKGEGGHREKVAIIPLPAGSEANLVQLGSISERDMGFVNYRADNIQRTLTAFRMAPIFLALSASGNTAGQYDAEVQRAITLEQVFDPEQTRYEQRLQNTLLRDLGYSHMRINFKRLAVENDQARRDGAVQLGTGKAITLREFRAAFGLAPLPEATKGAVPEDGQYPHGINDRLIDMTPTAAAAAPKVTDQRGQQPGIGSRQQQSTDNELATQAQQNRQPFTKEDEALLLRAT
jgi:capsid portal protein